MNIAARVPALSLLLLFGLLMSCRFERDANVADTIIRNGVIYDGSGAAPRTRRERRRHDHPQWRDLRRQRRGAHPGRSGDRR